ncbi:MAG: thioredoxin fold domain-containing protein [Epsilonproteobacteria bacterium]|nr:thioredoxin fold domain-containing protein [Campylobacterota bacterium]
MRIAIIFLISTFLFGVEIKFSKEINITKKPIILIFDTKTCPYCEKLKRDLTTNKELKKEADSFDIYQIPRDRPTTYKIFGVESNTQMLEMLYKVKVSPYIVILDSKGNKVWQIPGYIDPFKLSKLLKFTKALEKGEVKRENWKEFLLKEGVFK